MRGGATIHLGAARYMGTSSASNVRHGDIPLHQRSAMGTSPPLKVKHPPTVHLGGAARFTGTYPHRRSWGQSQPLSRPAPWAHSRCRTAAVGGYVMRQSCTTRHNQKRRGYKVQRTLYCAPLYISRSVTPIPNQFPIIMSHLSPSLIPHSRWGL